MDTKQKFRLGLQWGALAWLGYITVQALRAAPFDPRLLFILESEQKALPWLIACVCIAVGSRWARASVLLGILVQLIYGVSTAVFLYPRYTWPQLGMSCVVLSSLQCTGIAMCLGMLPLVLWRVEHPRVVLALLALGRWRDAWARSGGAVAVLAALPVIALNHALRDVFDGELVSLSLIAVLGVFALARYGEVMFAWPRSAPHPSG